MRRIININQNWKFIQKDAGLPDTLPVDWKNVNLPHCWNAVDGMDGNGSFDRGSYWYAKSFETPKQPLPGGRVYVEVNAAGQQATVYVNGAKAVYHEGGYSRFRADVTDLVRDEGENLLVINCSNEFKESVYPQSADFTFYGGLYRGVNLISVPHTHFDLDYYGGPGIMVTPKPCEKCGGATFEIETFVSNPDENFTVLYSIKDADGQEVAGGARPADDTKITLYVPDAHLWDMDHPYLYTVTALLQRRNEAYDEISTRAGVRSFYVTPDEGFFINGVQTPLRGVSRHQDRLYKGNALSREEHYEDAQIIKELGANTIRLAHYQHSQDFYDACDELGFAVWAEIPFISVYNKSPEAHQNCIQQIKELVTQNYNHPAICFWGISNEIFIGEVVDDVFDRHRELNALVKEMDPTRLTTLADLGMTPWDSPINHITDLISYNHYMGWYQGKMEDNGPWLDAFHAQNPDICLGMSEYGCEGILTYHGANPEIRDYSEDYQARYHEHLAKVLSERPYMWSTHVWNMFDFGCAARNEGGVAGRNNKGLVTIDRKTRKDSFYVYQAYWLKTPMVHIAGRRYAQRAGETTEVRVYSNQKAVKLYVNGELVEEQFADKVFVFTVALKDGQNILVVDAGAVKDSITLEKVEQEPTIYTLPDVQERKEGVANWFKMFGDTDLKSGMKFPEGKYNVDDKMSEIWKSQEALDVVMGAMSLFFSSHGQRMETKKDEPNRFYERLKNMSVRDMMDMMAANAPEGFLESINVRLTEIDKA